MKTLSTSALIARINRRLAHDYERLCTTRQGSRFESSVGAYYVKDYNFNVITATHCDPEALGRALGVLRDTETVGEPQEQAA